MQNVTRIRLHHFFFALLPVLLLSTVSVQAQSSFVLSRASDFSTDDRSFDRGDVLYVQIVAPHINFADLDDNEFRLKPSHDGNDMEGVLTNNFDGTYAAILPLENTDSSVSDWEWRARLKDDAGSEFEMRVSVQIGAGATGIVGNDDPSDDDNGQSGNDDPSDDDNGQSGNDDPSDDDNGQDDNQLDEVELTGTVDLIEFDHIVVAGTDFAVNNLINVFDHDGFPIPYSDLMIGGLVEIRGDIDASGTLIATRIHVEDGEEDEVEITGTVDEIGGDFITVAGVSFVTSDVTVVLDNNRNPITLSDLSAGMLVEIRGERDFAGTLAATDIKIEDGLVDEVEITGVIESITSEMIVVLGQVFHILGPVQVLDNGGNTIEYSSLTVGQLVEIRGELQPGGDLVALRIKLEDNSSANFRIVAPVQRVGLTSLDLLGTEYIFGDNVQITSSESTNLTRFDLLNGQTVEVDASVMPDGAVVAKRVELQLVAVITGAVASSRTGELSVEGLSFVMDDRTIVLNSENTVVPASEVLRALRAEVRGVLTQDGFRATKLKLSGTASSTASESEEFSTPSSFRLTENYPNPFNPTTTITFELSVAIQNAQVELSIFDVLGRKVKTLISSGQFSSGLHQISWNGTNDSGLPATSGLYLYRLRVADQVQTRTMTLLK